MLFQPNTTYILDGAFGTEVQRRGFDTALPLWSAKVLFEHPEAALKIHQDYIEAGADIITTATFRTQRYTLKKRGLEHEWERINKLAVDLCVQARERANVNRPVWIAGSMTALEDCYRVDLVPDDATLLKEHTEQANFLAQQPIDLLWIETVNTVREAKAAAQAASATGKPFVVSFVLDMDANLMSGEPLADAVAAIDPYKPEAYSVNCIATPLATLGIQKLKALTNKPIGAYANGDGRPSDDLGWMFEYKQNLIEAYRKACETWKKEGASIIGGCCGTNPDYTRAYSQLK